MYSSYNMLWSKQIYLDQLNIQLRTVGAFHKFKLLHYLLYKIKKIKYHVQSEKLIEPFIASSVHQQSTPRTRSTR